MGHAQKRSQMKALLPFLFLGCVAAQTNKEIVFEKPITAAVGKAKVPTKEEQAKSGTGGLLEVFGGRSTGNNDFIRINVDCPGGLNQKCTYNFKPDELKKLNLSELGNIVETCRKTMAKDQKFKGGQLTLIFNLDKSGGAAGLRSISNESSIAGFDDCVIKSFEGDK